MSDGTFFSYSLGHKLVATKSEKLLFQMIHFLFLKSYEMYLLRWQNFEILVFETPFTNHHLSLPSFNAGTKAFSSNHCLLSN